MVSKIRNWFVCWWSINYYNIHKKEDDIRGGIPDNYGEYNCKRCGKIFKL